MFYIQSYENDHWKNVARHETLDGAVQQAEFRFINTISEKVRVYNPLRGETATADGKPCVWERK